MAWIPDEMMPYLIGGFALLAALNLVQCSQVSTLKDKVEQQKTALKQSAESLSSCEASLSSEKFQRIVAVDELKICQQTFVDAAESNEKALRSREEKLRILQTEVSRGKSRVRDASASDSCRDWSKAPVCPDVLRALRGEDR